MDEMNRPRAGEKFLYLNHVPPLAHVTPEAPARDDAETDGKQALDELLRIMREEGMNPAVQLAGYFVTEDPTYLPAEHHARALARRVGRDKLLGVLIEQYVHTLTATESGEDGQ